MILAYLWGGPRDGDSMFVKKVAPIMHVHEGTVTGAYIPKQRRPIVHYTGTEYMRYTWRAADAKDC